MGDRSQPILRLLGLLAVVAFTCAAANGAHADVYGRLRFSVKDADTEKPLPNAKIVLKDSANVRPDVTLTTDAQGSAITPQLENRAWQITTTPEQTDTYQPDTRTVTVVNDTTTDVEILLEPVKEKVIKITGTKSLVNKSQTNNTTVRDQNFLQKIPASGANPQSLQKVLLTAPGLVEDSVNQAHPRGEHSSTAININGFYLPGALQGRAGPLLIPDTFQSVDILTGSYAPEYGGETAAILNINLRSGPITPLRSLYVDGGEFSTYDGLLTIGGQLGQPIGTPNANGQVARRFGYFLNFSARSTNNALEPPQPDDQTAHNSGSSITGFGNFNYDAGSRDHFSAIFNTAPAYTQIADRTGTLSDYYKPVGQGLGYIGLRNRDGTEGLAPGLTAIDPNALGAQPIILPSESAEGQNINQRDINDFGVLNWRHDFGKNLFGLLSFGLVHTGQEIKNNNPAVDVTNLPVDNSIEFNPTAIRNAHQTQFQGSLTYTVRSHTVKGGLLFDDQEGDESYQLIPASQLALDAEFVNDNILAPAGTPQVDAKGNPVLDVAGNQVYLINKANPTVPIVNVHRSGFYRAGYLQDTWNINRKATLNYGVRGDWYKQTQNLGQPTISEIVFSPRINFAYAFNPRTIGRASYNRLFIQPPLAQGAIIGAAILPETLDQFDVSVERQLAPTQTIKLAAYYKEIQNQIDTGLLVPFTQIGIFSSVNFQKGHVRGIELTYNLVPRTYVGLYAYLSYTYSLAKPTGLANNGTPAPVYNDHDQLNTVSAGAAYTLKSGANFGADLYFGSGVNSSDVFGNGHRVAHTRVNVDLSTGPGLFGGGPNGHGGLTLSIENIFDDRSVINFDSGFSGTRFVQGRRILLALFGKF